MTSPASIRSAKIAKGKLWQVENRINGEILCEGSKTECVKWLRDKGHYRQWKRGKTCLSLGKLLWENNPLQDKETVRK